MLVLYSKISASNHEGMIQKYLSFFDKKFISKILNHKRWQDRQSSLLGRLMLIECFRVYGISGIEINNILYNKFGKPFLNRNPVFFNISHSGEFVVCAITDQTEIGIDIELMKRIRLDDFKSCFTEREWNEILFAESKNNSFFEYWTQKEAVVKAHGNGLSVPLASFDISDSSTIINDETYFLKEIKVNEFYKCYVAQKQVISNIIIKELRIDNYVFPTYKTIEK